VYAAERNAVLDPGDAMRFGSKSKTEKEANRVRLLFSFPLIPTCLVMIVVMIIIVVVTEVDTNVEVLVVPIRFVVTAPLSVPVHLGDVVADLAALLAVAAGITIDSGAIRLEPTMAIFFPILIRASGTAESEYHAAGQCGRENHPTP
jgi:hypothetical protein